MQNEELWLLINVKMLYKIIKIKLIKFSLLNILSAGQYQNRINTQILLN